MFIIKYIYFEPRFVLKKTDSLRIIAGTTYTLETKNKLLIDSFKKVCLCRSIKAGTITTAIEEGSLTFEALRKNIGVGTGNCKAKRCRTKIESRIKDYKDNLNTKSETGDTPCG